MNAFFLGVAIAAAGASSTAPAERFSPTPVFQITPLSEAILAGIRGQVGTSRLTVAAMTRMVDDNGRADLRQTGSVGRIQMDVWWGTTGSELIAENVRAADGR